MYTINKTYEFTQEIKKSTFTCTLIPVNSIEEVNENLKQIVYGAEKYIQKSPPTDLFMMDLRRTNHFLCADAETENSALC